MQKKQLGAPKPDQNCPKSASSHWLGGILLQRRYVKFLQGNQPTARLPEKSNEKSEEVHCFLPQGI